MPSGHTNSLLKKSSTSFVVDGPPIFKKTMAVGPFDPVAFCVTGGTVVARPLRWSLLYIVHPRDTARIPEVVVLSHIRRGMMKELRNAIIRVGDKCKQRSDNKRLPVAIGKMAFEQRTFGFQIQCRKRKPAADLGQSLHQRSQQLCRRWSHDTRVSCASGASQRQHCGTPRQALGCSRVLTTYRHCYRLLSAWRMTVTREKRRIMRRKRLMRP